MRDVLIEGRLVSFLEHHKISVPSVHAMISLSARITHPKGNLRYEDFIFEVQSGTLIRVSNQTKGVDSNDYQAAA